ncbi:MAG: bifunctional [glutamine synthetase] adenylyltransferase/[glutamine synthetase]-adenylyl-L-tyrosine phosphorylase [Alphaproteobacteria bacterium]|nr:bifunctional [glutamine synthetase] adenylyltransferase/[glutamine synthetase]-adenylyl-L-tyrosine phosphorylase [Alphaproteobacteria bacterium]
MSLDQKNANLLSKDDMLYSRWQEEFSDLPSDAQTFFCPDGQGDWSVRYWLKRLKEASPYLVRLLFTEKEFLAVILQKGYFAAFKDLMKESFSRLYGLDDTEAVSRELRLLKRRAALVVALADIAAEWSLSQVTHALSILAEACLRIAVCAVLKHYAAKGDLVLPDPKNPEKDCGLFLIAMGKLGAGELNYSSDIDLIVLYDEEKVPYTGKKDPGAFCVKATKEIISLIDDKTPYGYVFRTDLRLRPDPGSTPVALSTSAAACYYESFAQNWERAAFIKARPVAGDKQAGTDFLKEIKPFVWRRTTDFYALQQISSIKRSLGARSADSPDQTGFNVKLGQGGIREIEFFTQLQQLLWGGRDPHLRFKSTLVALNALTKAGWVKQEDHSRLEEAYVFLRTLEHRLQMMEDQQTQTLPASSQELNALADLMNFGSYDDFRNVLKNHCANVRRIYDSLFAEEGHEADQTLSFSGTELPQETATRLIQMGFKDLTQIGETVRGWLSGRYRALRSDRARELMSELLSLIFNALSKNENPDMAFLAFDEFLRGLPAGIQLFSLFQSRPELLDLLAELIGQVPALARELTYHSSLFDAVLNPDFFSDFPDEEMLCREAQALLELAEDDEQALDTIRRFVREKKFKCAVLFLHGQIGKDALGQCLSSIVTAALNALCPVVVRTFEKKYGAFENGSFSLILLGKAGSREMSFSSDLDLLFIYDVSDQESGSVGGTSSLTPGVYYARLAQRIVNALTANTREGVLWPVDMRLRPSGSAGPAATSLEAFCRYYDQSAWTWEFMALTKARVVWGTRDCVGKLIQAQLCKSRDPEKLKQDVSSMRAKIANQHYSSSSLIDRIKYNNGGMIDIEFSLQYLQLKYAEKYPDLLQISVLPVLEKAASYGLIDSETATGLSEAYRLWTIISGLTSLCQEDTKSRLEGFSPTTIKLLCDFCAAENGDALNEKIEQTAKKAALYRLF